MGLISKNETNFLPLPHKQLVHPEVSLFKGKWCHKQPLYTASMYSLYGSALFLVKYVYIPGSITLVELVLVWPLQTCVSQSQQNSKFSSPYFMGCYNWSEIHDLQMLGAPITGVCVLGVEPSHCFRQSHTGICPAACSTMGMWKSLVSCAKTLE